MIKKFLFSFIGSDDTKQIQPVYIWCTILMILIITGIVLKFSGDKNVTTQDLGILIGLVTVLFGGYQYDRHGIRKDEGLK